MDDDDLRRGRPTCHKAVRRGDGDPGGRRPAGPGVRGAGRRTSSRRTRAARCCAALARAAGADGLVGGQADDLAGGVSRRSASRALESIHRRKTGALIRGVAASWAASSPARPPSSSPPSTTYGEQPGTGVSDHRRPARRGGRRGRRRQADRQRRATAAKLTYPALLGVDESRRSAAAAHRRGLCYDRAIRSDSRAACERWPDLCVDAKALNHYDDHSTNPAHDRFAARPAASCRCRSSSSSPARCARCCATWSAAAPPTSRRTWASSSCAWRCTDVRLPPRPADLGHRPPDLSAQADHRPLSRSSTRSAPRAA